MLLLLNLLLADADADAGRALFLGQASLSAHLAGSRDALPATATACANCHGWTGQGGREANIEVTDISYASLTVAANRRGERTSRYSPATFCAALRQGTDPNGEELSRAMPRYTITEPRCLELWEYLRDLENRTLVGADDTVIRVAVVGARSTRSQIVDALLARFQRSNREGGVWGRRLEVTGDSRDAAALLVLEGQPPALAPPVVIDWEHRPAADLQLVADPSAQARSLLARIAPASAVVLLPGKPESALLAAIRAELRDGGKEPLTGWGALSRQCLSPAPLTVVADRLAVDEVRRALTNCRAVGAYYSPVHGGGVLPGWTSYRIDAAPAELDADAAGQLGEALITALRKAGRRLRVRDLRLSLAAAFSEKSGDPQRWRNTLFLQKPPSVEWVAAR